MRAAGFLVGVLLAGSLRAGLSNAGFSGPATVSGGQVVTLYFSVQNSSGASGVSDVRPVIGFSSAGYSPSLLSGPQPASVLSLAPGGTAVFTWTFSGGGCGDATFTGTAEGTEAGTPVASSAASYQVSLYCTPTPTPTPSPVLSATPTPWIVHVTQIVPSAQIRGNLFHPLLGQPLQLEAVLPEAGVLNVEIFDRLGKKLKGFSLNSGAGAVSLAWDGRSDDGLLVSSGIYVAQFRARDLNVRVKFAVIK